MIEVERLISQITSRHGLVTQDRWSALLVDAIAQAREDQVAPPPSVNNDLVDRVAGLLTVGETFFMRHGSQFSHVSEHILKTLRSNVLAPVRVLSAGCSTGEEPYSLAASLSLVLPSDQMDRVEIQGVDLNPEAIEKARTARYSKWSFRGSPPWLLAGFFDATDDLHYQLRECVRNRVTFAHGSILDTVSRTPAGSLDIVLFRNVGIYFCEDHLRRVFDAVASALDPNGLLVVAPSDPRPSLKVFARTAHESTAVYRLLSDADRADQRQETPKAQPGKRRQERRKQPFGSRMVDSVKSKPRPPTPANVLKDHERAIELADQGKWREALQLADRLVGEDFGSFSSFLLRGQLHLAGERREDGQAAVEDLRRAVFLNPTDPIVRYWYAHALMNTGRSKKAMAQISAMTQLVVHTVNDAYFQRHGLSRQELLEAAEVVKETLR